MAGIVTLELGNMIIMIIDSKIHPQKEELLVLFTLLLVMFALSKHLCAHLFPAIVLLPAIQWSCSNTTSLIIMLFIILELVYEPCSNSLLICFVH